MVRDDDSLRAPIDRGLRIIDVHDAFNDNRDVDRLAHLLDHAPVRCDWGAIGRNADGYTNGLAARGG